MDSGLGAGLHKSVNMVSGEQAHTNRGEKYSTLEVPFGNASGRGGGI